MHNSEKSCDRRRTQQRKIVRSVISSHLHFPEEQLRKVNREQRLLRFRGVMQRLLDLSSQLSMHLQLL